MSTLQPHYLPTLSHVWRWSDRMRWWEWCDGEHHKLKIPMVKDEHVPSQPNWPFDFFALRPIKRCLLIARLDLRYCFTRKPYWDIGVDSSQNIGPSNLVFGAHENMWLGSRSTWPNDSSVWWHWDRRRFLYLSGVLLDIKWSHIAWRLNVSTNNQVIQRVMWYINILTLSHHNTRLDVLSAQYVERVNVNFIIQVTFHVQIISDNLRSEKHLEKSSLRNPLSRR